MEKMKFLLALLTLSLSLLLILPFPANAPDANFYVVQPSPASADAGTEVNLMFTLYIQKNLKILQIYVPPCNNYGCSESPYYDIKENTIMIYSGTPADTTVISRFGGKISNITWIWEDGTTNYARFSFNTTTNTPPENREDKWECKYQWSTGYDKKETKFNVLAPKLKILELDIEPKEVTLSEEEPETIINVDAVITNVKDESHSGNSYGLNPSIVLWPSWNPQPSQPSTNGSLDKLLSGKAILIHWDLIAQYEQTDSGVYDVSVMVSDENGYLSGTVSDEVNVTINETVHEPPGGGEPPPVQPSHNCTKCFVKTLICPTEVKVNSNFDISYEINASDRYEVQTILLGGEQFYCGVDNFFNCSIKSKSKTITSPSTPGAYEIKVGCYASLENSASYCGNYDDYKTCSLQVKKEEVPTSLSLDIISPEVDQEFLMGEKLLLKTKLTYQNGSIVKGALVKAVSPFLDIQLLDDGKVEDEEANDGVYAASVFVPGAMEIAPYTIIFSATKNSYYTEKYVNIQIKESPLSVTLLTDKFEYFKGENIRIQGRVYDNKGNIVQYANVLINFSSESWGLSSQILTNEEGQFFYDYPISFGDPDGDWTILVSVEDEYGNEGQTQGSITVRPPATLYYSLEFIEPTKGYSYERGESFDIRVGVMRGDESVKGASVTCKNPLGTIIELKESGGGVYSEIYNISFKDPLGINSITCEVKKEEDGDILRGGSFTNILINSTKLEIKILSPNITTLNSRESILFVVEAKYPSGELVKGGSITLNFQGETLAFGETKDGIYTTTIRPKDKGEFLARVSAKDGYGNEIESDKEFLVKFSWFYFVLDFWWLPFLGWLPLTFVGFKYFREGVPKDVRIRREIAKYKKELRQVEKMQAITQNEYFQRKIDELSFKRMMEDLEQKVIELQVKINDLDTELERIKVKKER